MHDSRQALATPLVAGTSSAVPPAEKARAPNPDRRLLQGAAGALHPMQSSILRLVAQNPGLTLSRICRILALNRGTATYHLRRLGRDGAVIAETHGARRRFFPPSADPTRRAQAALSPRARALAEAIRQFPGMCQKDLLVVLGVTRKEFRRHLRAVAGIGMVDEFADGRFRVYYPTEGGAS